MTRQNRWSGVVITAAAMFLLAQKVVLGESMVANPMQKVGAANNAFASDLYAHLASDKGNLFFSPTSIETALAMTWAGARGQTARQMAQTMHLDDQPGVADQFGAFQKQLDEDGKKGGYELATANALWGAKGYVFDPGYLNLVQTKFGGHLRDLDFATNPDASRLIINGWVADQTHDKIKDLLPQGSIVPSVRLVLTNAIYFKANWDNPFQKSRTQDADFTTADGTTTKAPMMSQQAHFAYAEDADVQVLDMTYGNDDLAMRIYLPRKADGLPAFEKSLTVERMARLAGHMQQQEVLVSLPRFKVESSFNLGDVLQAMGMKLPFDAMHADFSGMSTTEPFFISLIVHKAYVNVDEEGTEAAAATGIVMRLGAVLVRVEPKVFRADHPFIFSIVHRKTGAILFMGRLARP
ncbi:MAG TPA: serpin family protein [Tepidisphaeraceae bacterium]|nr:serpin family protein [Tepidisphaeraceae bacterium]